MSKSRKIILALAVIGFLACVLSLVFYFWNTGRAQRAFDLLDSKRPVLNSAGFIAPERLEEIAEEEERPFNPDCIAWVTIPDTAVNYPVMQREGSNQYYLRRDFYGEYSQSGTPFLDAASDLADPDSPLYIFGHNMKSGTMFADLLRYRSADFCSEHPVIELETAEELRRYEIFAVIETETGTDELGIYDFAEDPARDLAAFCASLQEKALYDTGIQPEGQLLLLITCTNSYDEAGRFFVAAHRVE